MTFDLKLFEFNDFDRFLKLLSGWDTEPTQLSAGPLRIRLGHLDLGVVKVARLRLNRTIADRMAIDADTMMYVVCLAPKIFCGIEVPTGSLVVFGPGREYRSVLYEGWESFEIVVPRQVAEAEGLPLAGATSRDLAPELSVIPLTEALVAKFRVWARELFDPTWLDSPPDHPQLWTDAAREKTLCLLAAAPAKRHHLSAGVAELKPVASYGLAMAALDYIDRPRHERLTVREIGEAFGTSVRALQYAFQSAVGVTPSQYILAKRLLAARRCLLTSSARSARVTTVAVDHDFTHFGRFAQHYRRLFGETPSQTLRSTRL